MMSVNSFRSIRDIFISLSVSYMEQHLCSSIDLSTGCRVSSYQSSDNAGIIIIKYILLYNYLQFFGVVTYVYLSINTQSKKLREVNNRLLRIRILQVIQALSFGVFVIYRLYFHLHFYSCPVYS